MATALGRKPSLYHPEPTKPLLHSFANKGAIKSPLAAYIFEIQKDAISKKGKFTIAVSGGSLPETLSELVGFELNGVKVGWEHWHVFYADERCVPLDHADSNHRLCEDHIYSKLRASGVKGPTVHPIDDAIFDSSDGLRDHPENLTDSQLQEMALSYRSALVSEFTPSGATAAYPTFDLVLLGMGPDGHTCSLFPGKDFLFPDHELMAEFSEEEVEEERNAAWVGYVNDSPKPPPKRITLTYAVLNHASNVAFVAGGGEKAELLAKVLDQAKEVYELSKTDIDEQAFQRKMKAFLPSARIRPATGVLRWFVDDAATAKTSYPRSEFKL